MAEFLWVEADLHCGRVQLRRKKMKHSGVQLSNFFVQKNAKRSFSDDVVTVYLSCDADNLRGGLRMEGASIDRVAYNFTQRDVIPYSAITDIYISTADFRQELEKLADLYANFQLLGPETLTEDNFDGIVQNVLIVTRDLGCYLFFLKHKRGSLQMSIRKILQTLFTNKCAQLNKLSNSIAGIQFLDQRNLNDASLLCPFNNEGEWAAEISSCVATSAASYGPFKGFLLEIRRNPTWNGNLSQYYVVPKLFPSTIWLYTHANGSMLISADKTSVQLRRDAQIFDLDSLLWQPAIPPKPNQIFTNLGRQIVADHYKDWLASSAACWNVEDDFGSKWLNLVSETLRIVSYVVKAVASKDYSSVLLIATGCSLRLVVAALAQLCLSPNSRASTHSVNRLIQKYFVSLGFPFRLGIPGTNQPNYHFVLFLDCFCQLVCQNVTEFGITTGYLKTLAVSFISDYFFEFSFSSPSKRIDVCRRGNHNYRWFFPIEQNFNSYVIASFVNEFYRPPCEVTSFTTKPDLAVPIQPPISYYPFNLEAEKYRRISGALTRSHSDGNVADTDDGDDDTVSTNRISFASRMSSLAPRNIFRQRSHQTFVVYKPLVLRKAVIDQPLPSPNSYFGTSKTAPGEIIPRHHMACLRFWSDFFLAHEYDFDSFDEKVPPGGVQV